LAFPYNPDRAARGKGARDKASTGEAHATPRFFGNRGDDPIIVCGAGSDPRAAFFHRPPRQRRPKKPSRRSEPRQRRGTARWVRLTAAPAASPDQNAR